MEGYRNDKAAVAEALRRDERPDLATTMASGPLDELVALHEELGIFAIVEQLEVKRKLCWLLGSSVRKIGVFRTI